MKKSELRKIAVTYHRWWLQQGGRDNDEAGFDMWLSTYHGKLLTDGLITHDHGYVPYYNSVDKSVAKLRSIITQLTGVTYEEIMGKNRKRRFAVVRHLYFYICKREFPSMTLLQIADNKKDHATVIHGINMVKKLLQINDEIMTNLYDSVMELYMSTPSQNITNEIRIEQNEN